jgi:lysophospholipase L1-like esterase
MRWRPTAWWLTPDVLGVGVLGIGLLASGCGAPASEVPGTAPVGAAQAPAASPADAPDAELPAASPRRVAVVTDASAEAHRVAQLAMHGAVLPDDARVAFVPVIAAADARDPLANFHAALRKLQAGQDADGKVRIAAYGASSTAADRYVGYLRRYLQARFGDGGPGFVALVPLWRWHRHDRVESTASKHWTIEHAQKKKERLDGHYGLLGASASATSKRASARLRGRDRNEAADAIELWFLAQPGGGSMRVTAAGRTAVVDTATEAMGPGYFDLGSGAPVTGAGKATPRTLQIDLDVVGDGEVRLFGAVLEREAPGVVVDTLGIGGTRATNHVDWDEPLWRDGLQRRAPDLVMLAYGANESVDEDDEFALYAERLADVLGRFRQAVPAASCLLIGPQDFPLQLPAAEGDDDAPRYGPRPRLQEVIEIQRRLAAERGCGYFDTRAMMGGSGAMVSWVDEEPALGAKDHLHFTPLGYGYLGRTLADALMADYDDAPTAGD